MVCPKCKSENVNVQVVNEVKIKKGHGFIWWICIGWWWVPCKWFFFTIPALILAIFGHRKTTVKNKQVSKCVCQACGNVWNA